MNAFFLEFLTRDRCPLCEEGAAIANRVARILRCEVIAVQVEDDDDLLREYGLRIPVVRDPQGTVLAEGRIEYVDLLRSGLAARVRGIVSARS